MNPKYYTDTKKECMYIFLIKSSFLTVNIFQEKRRQTLNIGKDFNSRSKWFTMIRASL